MNKLNIKRTHAFLIDFGITCIIQFIIFFVVLTYVLLNELQIKDYIVYLVFGTFISFIYLLLKDAVNGKSIGKRIIEIKLIGYETNSISPIQAVLRSVPLILWPIELVLFFDGKPTIGEKISKTKIIEI